MIIYITLHSISMSTEIPSVGVPAFLCPPLPPASAQDIYPVGSLELSFTSPFQRDHPLSGTTATNLNLTGLCYLLPPVVSPNFPHFKQCVKSDTELFCPHFVPQVLQILIEHILSQIIISGEIKVDTLSS